MHGENLKLHIDVFDVFLIGRCNTNDTSG